MAKIGLELAKTMARKNNQSFQSMMLYNGAKKTFYLLILCINITKKTLFLAYKILIFDACQSLTAKYTTNYNILFFMTKEHLFVQLLTKSYSKDPVLFSLLQLAPRSRDNSSWEENNCYVKLSKFTKWQLFSLKMTTFLILDNFQCNYLSFLSFSQQLFSTQVEINHVIQEETEVN